jgi:hypothetical protein
MPSKRESSVVPNSVDDQPDSISLDQDPSQQVEQVEEGVSNSWHAIILLLMQ